MVDKGILKLLSTRNGYDSSDSAGISRISRQHNADNYIYAFNTLSVHVNLQVDVLFPSTEQVYQTRVPESRLIFIANHNVGMTPARVCGETSHVTTAEQDNQHCSGSTNAS